MKKRTILLAFIISAVAVTSAVQRMNQRQMR